MNTLKKINNILTLICAICAVICLFIGEETNAIIFLLLEVNLKITDYKE